VKHRRPFRKERSQKGTANVVNGGPLFTSPNMLKNLLLCSTEKKERLQGHEGDYITAEHLPHP